MYMINPEEIFTKLDSRGIIPTVAHDYDAGVDLYASRHVELLRNTTAKVHTDIKVNLPKGTVGLVVSRSGLAFKSRIRVFNSPGIIDCGYEGEIMIMLENCSPAPYYQVECGQRIAQMLIVEHQQLLCLGNNNIRGKGGLGSSGK
jgi:dUTP pyrophosphatase